MEKSNEKRYFITFVLTSGKSVTKTVTILEENYFEEQVFKAALERSGKEYYSVKDDNEIFHRIYKTHVVEIVMEKMNDNIVF